MATTTTPLFNSSSSNKVNISCSSSYFPDKTNNNHSRSKAQMYLKKIIDIISSGSSSSFLHQQCENLERISSSSNLIERVDELGKNEKVRDLFIEKRGFSIDLNLRLGFTNESENLTVNKGLSGDDDSDGKFLVNNIDCNSCVVFGEISILDKSSEGECDPKGIENSKEDFPEIEASIEKEDNEEIEEEKIELSEITNLPETENEGVHDENEDGEEEKHQQVEEEEEEIEVNDERENQKDENKISKYKKEGYLDLLVEAARMISGDKFEDEGEEEKRTRNRNRRFSIESNEESKKITEIEMEPNKSIGNRSKRNQCWMFDFYEDFEDISPVVRSKRGRNQVLPYRYRDSVLDPWKRLTKQRSSRVSSKNKT